MRESELQDLRERQEKLWSEVQALQVPFEAKRAEWHAVYSLLQIEEQRVRIEAEIRAELATQPTLNRTEGE